MLKVGDKVVCIYDNWDASFLKFHTVMPKKDQVYVIRGFMVHGDRLGIYLVGIYSNINPNGNEQSFDVVCFRKLDELKMENELKALRADPRILFNTPPYVPERNLDNWTL